MVTFSNGLTGNVGDVDLPEEEPDNPLQDTNVQPDEQDSTDTVTDSSNTGGGLYGDADLDNAPGTGTSTESSTDSGSSSGTDSSSGDSYTGINNSLTGDPEEVEDAYNDWQSGEETEDTASDLTDIPQSEDYQEDAPEHNSGSSPGNGAVDRVQDLARGWGQFLRSGAETIQQKNQSLGEQFQDAIEEKTDDPLGIETASQNAVKGIAVVTAGGVGIYAIRRWTQE